MITLVRYIGYLPNLTTWLPCGRGRTLFILGSLGQRSRSLTINIKKNYRLIIYIDRCILWCTHFLFSYIMERTSCISMRLWCPLCNNPTFFVQAHWSNSPRRDNSLHSDILSWFQANQSALATKCSKYQLYSIWFDPIRALTYDLLHPRRAR